MKLDQPQAGRIAPVADLCQSQGMAQKCPRCSQPIENDFGVVTCSNCGSVLFFDLDGQLQVNEQTEALQDQAMAAPDFESESSYGVEGGAEEQVFQSGESALPEEQPVVHHEALEEPVAETLMPVTESETIFSDEEKPLAESSPGFSDVQDFSNAETSSGPLSYSILIEEIDTKELRQKLAEILDDSKFQWDSKDLLKKVKMGKLKIENLTPVKASVLVQRLQNLSVKVSWVQNVFS